MRTFKCEECGTECKTNRDAQKLCGSRKCAKEGNLKRSQPFYDLTTSDVRWRTSFLLAKPLLPRNMYI